MLTKLCWDASSISKVCICLDKSLISIWAPWRASVFCDTCTCTSAIWQGDGERVLANKQDTSCIHIWKWLSLLRLHHLIFMPSFQFFCILHSNLLIVAPHFTHDLCQVLTFGGVDVYLHAWMGDLIPQLHHLLLDRQTEQNEGCVTGCVNCEPPLQDSEV